METTTTIIDCHTCLYMATHERCDGCLHTEADWAEYRQTHIMPPFRYLHYQEGNWMDRVIQAEIDGTRNIVIGGQGEAEVNTQWTPEKTTKHLHYVAEQCGYMCGRLAYSKTRSRITLTIWTHEGQFRIIWANTTGIPQLIGIWDVDNPKGWKWENHNPFRQAS